MTVQFREIPKEPLNAIVPPELAQELREIAVREQTTISAVTTRYLCVGLGRNPRRYGLERLPPKQRGRPIAI